MRYYISDQHFGHGKLNTAFDFRGFPDVETMDQYMISQWNKKVRKNDEVVIIGDFCISRDGEKANQILRQLNGTKYLITGNHDKYLKSPSFDHKLYKWENPYRELNDNNRKVVLSHYPVFCYNKQYQKKGAQATTYMLYGHVHNTADEYLVNEFQKQTREYIRPTRNLDEYQAIPCQMINCFCMFSDYTPLTLDEWIEVDKKRRSEMDIANYNIRKA